MEDDEVMLRPDTLAILQQFLQEKKESEAAVAESGEISENFGLSQFWYDIPTRTMIAQEV